MNASLPSDYAERVYAGVLGKLIGVYLGRPFEGWSGEAIMAKWGQIDRYVHEDQKVPLIVSDDDITGTFIFLRALLDHESGAHLTAREIGQTWLNYIAPYKHILWWGGMGMSTEHTAFFRLFEGLEAPQSGSIETNGKAVAEEIGAQIFIDGWAMVSPNQPDQAARLAREAARVSHDGEAVHGAVALAVMESLAFSLSDLSALQEAALAYLPEDCEIACLIRDLRQWHQESIDWKEARQRLISGYGYEKYGTNCPMVTNHGVIQLALLWGGGDFDRSLMIANTCGFDTDCNSGNVGCLLGIRGGLPVLQSGYDWRTPVNDRMYLPSADGHWGCRDAARVAQGIIQLGQTLAGLAPEQPKGGAKFHFTLPGSTHGFTVLDQEGAGLESTRGLPQTGLRVQLPGKGFCRLATNTFAPPEDLAMAGYGVSACPELYPGQTVRASVLALASNRAALEAVLQVEQYQADLSTRVIDGPSQIVAAGEGASWTWKLPELGPWPICRVGFLLQGAAGDSLVVEMVDFAGTPNLLLQKPSDLPKGFTPWHRMFQHNLSQLYLGWMDDFNLCSDRDDGLLHTGSLDWTDYAVSTELFPCLGNCGLLGRVRGLRQYYAAELIHPGRLRLVRHYHQKTILAETSFPWRWREKAALELRLQGPEISVWSQGRALLAARDPHRYLTSGGVGLLVSQGRLQAGPISLKPLDGEAVG